VAAPGTLVVGVGNDDRGDDGVGPLVARLLACALATDPPAGVAVVPGPATRWACSRSGTAASGWS
jgi:Ni,Fe-hydrogenase maturation factor